MKIFSSLLLLVLIYSCLLSSSSPSGEKDTVTIQGICLDNTKTEKYVIRTKYGIKEVKVSPSGFEVEIDCMVPSIVEIIIGKNKLFPVYIEPAKKLTMVYSETDIINRINSIEYKGSNAIENKILFELGSYYKYHDPNEFSFFNCSEDVFINRLDSIKTVGFNILEKKRSEFPSLKNSFLMSAKNYIDYSIAYYLEIYPEKIRRNFAKKEYQESYKYALYKNKYLKEDATLLNCISYLYYIDAKRDNLSFQIRSSESYPQSSNEYSDLKSEFLAIDSIFSEKEIIDYLRYIVISNAIYFREDENIAKYFAIYRQDAPPPYYINTLEPLIKNLTKKYKDGMFIPTYSFLDTNGIRHVLEEFKGKVLYIDIWATWCFPCHQEREYFEKLMDDFDVEDIAFIGISLDKQKDEERWKKMVKKSNIKGIQLLADKDFDSQICKDFNVNSIPRFILIDSGGEIIQTNAIRPSDPEINRVLASLIGK